MEWGTVIVAVIFLVIAYVHMRNKHLPPGPYGLPLLGYTLFLGRNPVKTFTKLKESYGNVMSINLGGMTPVVVLNDWAAVKEAIVKQADSFSGRCDNLLTRLLADNSDITFTDGNTWRSLRRFSHNSLRNFGFGSSYVETLIMEDVDILSEHLKGLDGKPLLMDKLFFIPLMNIIWGLSAGKRFEMTDKYVKSFKDDVTTIMKTGALNILNHLPFLRYILPRITSYEELSTACKKIRDYLGKEVDNHMENFDKNNLKDFIDVFLAEIERRKINGKEEQPFDRKHLVSIIFDFFIAGQDTTDTTLCWAFLYMVTRPDIVQKIQKELDGAFDKDSFLTLASKSQVPYTEATLMEIQRMSTIVPLALPHRATKRATLLGHNIPKNTKVLVNLYAVHHDKKYWGDPEVFRPERFLDDNGSKVIRHEFFVPFSVGPRTCMGESLARMELFLFFTCLMRRFSFELPEEASMPTLEPVFGIVSKPHPFTLIVKCR